MNLLITGGCGFIGRNFIEYMNATYPAVKLFVVDKLTYAADRKFAHEELRMHVDDLLFIDINNITGHTLENWGITHIVNFAAETHVDNSITGPGIFTVSNTMGTHNLLEWSRKLGIKKFVQVSTDEVYGSLGDLGYFNESTPLNPSSPYSASKAAADQMCLAYWKTYKFPICVTRCSNNYGPYQHVEKLIPKAITDLLSGKKVKIYGSGRNVRDWIYVKDHCSAIAKVLMDGRPGEVYNIGSNSEEQNMAIAKFIVTYMYPKTEVMSKIEYVEDRKGHDFRYAVDSTKIREELNWAPEVTIGDALKSTIDWYVNKYSWAGSL